MATFKIASFNIYKHLTDSKTMKDLNALLSVEGLDAVGLQEIDWAITPEALPASWDFHQAPAQWSRKDPVIWDSSTLRQVAVGHEEVADPVGEGNRNTPRRAAAWVVFDGAFIHLNLHFNADLEGRPGHPKPDSRRPEENYQTIRKVLGIADRLQAEYDLPIVVTADFNVDFGADRRVQHRWFPYVNFTRAGFVCCWEGFREESTRRRQPVKGRTIDQMWARGTRRAKVKFRRTHTPNRWGPGNPVSSDHLPVIADLVIAQGWVERVKGWF